MRRLPILATVGLLWASALAAQDAQGSQDARGAQVAQEAPARPAEERAVLDVVDRLFEGMRLGDTIVVRSVFHPDARLVTTGMRGGEPAVAVVPIDGFIAAVGGATQVWDERTFDAEVRIDDNLATVWNGYVFYIGDRFDHCGVDSFQLVRTPDGWKIIQVADTQRTEGCDALIERANETGANA